MENEKDVKTDPSSEKVDETVKEDVKIPSDSAPKTEDKVVPYERFKEVNDELARLKKQPVKTDNKSLDVEDYIDISASLEGLDQREKEKLAKEHKLTGRPLTEIRKDEDFLLWQSAYKGKLEKDKALAPSSKQTDSELPRSFEDRVANATTLADKEKLLVEAGLYKNPQGPRSDRQYIGSQR